MIAIGINKLNLFKHVKASNSILKKVGFSLQKYRQLTKSLYLLKKYNYPPSFFNKCTFIFFKKIKLLLKIKILWSPFINIWIGTAFVKQVLKKLRGSSRLKWKLAILNSWLLPQINSWLHHLWRVAQNQVPSNGRCTFLDLHRK